MGIAFGQDIQIPTDADTSRDLIAQGYTPIFLDSGSSHAVIMISGYQVVQQSDLESSQPVTKGPWKNFWNWFWGVPVTPETPTDTVEVPITPDTTEVPIVPITPDTTEVPITPEIPDTPVAPVAPDCSGCEMALQAAHAHLMGIQMNENDDPDALANAEQGVADAAAALAACQAGGGDNDF